MASGSIGTTFFKTPVSIGITLGSNTYPKGTFCLTDVMNRNAFWRKDAVPNCYIDMYLCDSAGNNKYYLFRVEINGGQYTTSYTPYSATVDAIGLKGKALYMVGVGYAIPNTSANSIDYIRLFGPSNITLDTAEDAYSITCSAGTGGSLTASASSASPGATVTLYPSASTGYYLTGYTTSPSVTITNNTFTMPSSAITITANFAKVSYSVSTSAGTGGSLSANKSTATMGETVTLTPTASTGYHFSSYSTSPSLSISNNQFTMPAGNVSITANFAKTSYSITVSAGTGGSLTASKSTATMGEAITLTPSPNTGYYFTGYTTSVTVSNNQFTMPAGNVSVTANFAKITYTISKSASPSGGGTVTTSANSATMGTSVTVSQTPATGYYFNGWTTSPSLTISGGAFTMPASNVSITANYLKRSTASINKTTLTGGDTATLTISPDKTTYTHKYKLSFGTNMETGWESVAANVRSVAISIPNTWSDYIPNATTKSGGTLVVKTYNGSTEIGSYTISNLTYAVNSSVVPTIGTITTSVVRTIGGTTYANVGNNIYVQKHCGVRIQATASGARSSTISSMSVSLSGYTGGSYSKTVSSGSLDFTTGLLTISGTTTITITTTDSRGRTNSKTATISVSAYNNPTGSLEVWRVNSGGTAYDRGEYGKYTKTQSYTAVGNNTLTVTLSCGGNTATNPADTGDIMPGNRLTFSIEQEYIVTLVLADAFETTVITDKLKSARFLIYVNENGDKMGIMKATTKTIPSGKDSTFEISESTQVYIGDETLEAYIRRIAGS